MLRPTTLTTVYGLMAFGLGLNYTFNLFMAILLGAEEFGTFSVALTIFNTTDLLSVLSLDSAALRFLPPLLKTGDFAEASRYERGMYMIALTSSAIFGTALYFVTRPLSEGVFDNSRLVVLLHTFAMSLPLFVVVSVMAAALQARDALWPRMLVRYVVEPTTRVIIAIALLGLGFGVLAPVLGIAVSLLLSTTLFAVWQGAQALFSSTTVCSRSQVNEILRFCLPLLAGSVFVVAAARADLLIVGALLDNRAAGVYAAALQTAAILSIVLQGVETVFMAHFARLCAPSDRKELETLYQDTLRWTVLSGTPLALVLLCAPEQVLWLFGAEYAQAATSLRVIAAAQFVNLLTGSANALLLVSGQARLIMWNNLAFSTGLVVSVFVGTSYFGILGTAVGVAVPTVLLNIVRVVQVQHLLGCQPYSRYLLKVGAAFLLTGTVCLLLGSRLGVLGVFVYPGFFLILILVLGLHPKDKEAVGL